MAAGKPTLVPLQRALVPLPVLRVADPPARGQGSEVLQSHIHAHALAGRGQRRWIGDVRVEGHEPALGRIAGHGHRRGIQQGHINTRPGPYEAERRSRLRQPQRPVLHAECGPGVGRGLAAVPRLKPRVTGAPGEKRSEGRVLVSEGLLERDRGDIVQKREVGVLLQFRQRPVGLGIADALALGLVAGVPFGQGAVPHNADAAKRARQHLLLRVVGVCPAPVCRPHSYMMTTITVKPWEARRTRFLPGLKAGVSTREVR